MERCLLLHARRYDFKDQESGRRVEGVTLTYLTSYVEGGDNQRGQMPLSISAPAEAWHQLRAVPGFYEVDFRQRPGPKGRPTLQATGLHFLSPVEFEVDDQESTITHPLRTLSNS